MKNIQKELRIVNCFFSNRSNYVAANTFSNGHKEDGSYRNKIPTSRFILIGSLGVLGFHFNEKKKQVYCAQTAPDSTQHSAGNFKEGLPLYSQEEVKKHSTLQNRIWMTYKEGVYDVTDFIEGHPGGDQILLAAGSAVDPFWNLYKVHENPHVYEILETYRIGNLNIELGHVAEISDPYSDEPTRNPALKPTSLKPFNAECHPSLLVENFLTPNELFYVRNHLPVPDIDPETYRLEVEIEGTDKTCSFTLDELKNMPKRSITATIMCAGNRRSEMTKVKPVKGLNWGPAAIGNAVWTGVPLRELLKKAGVNEDDEKYKHVQFEAEDFDVTGASYGASIQFWKAIDKRGDVLLAYEMNGEPLPRDHGFPIKVIVPGVVGARNVKWLSRIVVSENESNSHWQQNDYKGFSPSVDWDCVDYRTSPAIQELPVVSAICKPSDGDTVEVIDGHISIKGYAWSGGGQKIIRVDVTIDGGKTWHVANFDHQDTAEPPRHWAWTLWSLKVPVDKKTKTVEIWAKAVDSSYNTQPESFENIWNLRGVLSNAYHRVKVTLV